MLKLKRTTVAGEPVDNIVENMCGVTCRARRVAMDKPGGSDHVFASVIRVWMQRKRSTEPICRCIALLNMFVTEGRVTWQQAGRLASVVYVWSDGPYSGHSYYGETLLRSAVNSLCKAKGCRCLRTLLSWGTCPHVTSVQLNNHMHVMQIDTPGIDLDECYAYGAPFWNMVFFREKSCKAAQGGEQWQRRRGHWYRWHARAAKRLWLALGFSSP